jgi:hypothetical protein
MVDPPPLVSAVEAAIVASAHLTAYEHLAAANRAVRRLGTLSSGRWRSAARDLQRLEDDLESYVANVTRDLAMRADNLGIDEEALWAAGDAAATLDLLREPALELLEADSPAASLLAGDSLFGVTVLEDAEAPDRGTTLVFSWAEPLAPASWAWQASWISSSLDEDEDEVEDQAEDQEEPPAQLDLYDAGELEAGEPMLAGVADQLNTDRAQAVAALRTAAAAVTRASLLLASGLVDELEEDEDGTAPLSR